MAISVAAIGGAANVIAAAIAIGRSTAIATARTKNAMPARKATLGSRPIRQNPLFICARPTRAPDTHANKAAYAS